MSDKNFVFFDLDDTLVDFRANVKETLFELYSQYDLASKGVESRSVFFERYDLLNRQMWAEYRNGALTQEALRNQRFTRVLEEFQISDQPLAQHLSVVYLEQVSEKRNLHDGALRVLEILVEKYELHIITNGFRDVQHKKISNASLNSFFKEIITSEDSGFLKPHPAMFQFALSQANASPEKSVYIGDSLEVDVKGASNAGIDSIYFNNRNEPHEGEPDYEISKLSDLLSIL